MGKLLRVAWSAWSVSRYIYALKAHVGDFPLRAYGVFVYPTYTGATNEYEIENILALFVILFGVEILFVVMC